MTARALRAALAAALALASPAAALDDRFAAVTLDAADACVALFRGYREQEGLDCFRPLVGICPRTLPADATEAEVLACVTAEGDAWEALIDAHARDVAAGGDRPLTERFGAIQAQGRERMAQTCRAAEATALGQAICRASQLPDLFVALRLDHLAMLDAEAAR